MKQTLLRVLLLALALSTPALAQEKAALSHGIDLSAMDPSVRPQDDFFRYVNGKWVDRTEIPAEMASFGSFLELRDKAAFALREIIEGAAAEKQPAGTIKQKVGDFYRSYMDTARIDALGLKPLQPELGVIKKVTSHKELPATFAHLARVGVRAPFQAGVMQDPKNSDVYAVSMGQSGLGMPDRDYYLRQDEKFAGIRKAYTDYITQLFTLAGQPDGAGAAQRILALETRLAEKQWDRARNRDRNATYNKMLVSDVARSAPAFDWPTYLSTLRGGAAVEEVIVRQPDYLKEADAIIASTPVNTWKEYLTFGLLSSYADDLPADFVKAQFNYTKVISGQQEMRPRWKRAISETESAVGEAVGKLYVEKHFTPAAKARMDELVKNLLAAFKVGIEELEWMSPATKAQAQDKLAKFKVKIGYPERWRDFTALQVDGADLVGNVMRARRFNADENWSRLGKPVERWRMGMTPQTVNASYNSVNNEITFPAGILQPPFFDMNADDAVNYGGIGAVIGHEISHGFDDQGRKSDGDGNLRDWWTAEDAAAFEERATRLGAQFEQYEPVQGMKINPKLTMGENIGDLSGLAVAYRAYRMSLNGKEAPVINGFTGDQRFFMGWTQVWRFKSREAALRNQLLTDSHSPGMFRAFAPLTNIDGFYQAFDVKPGDKMYREPAARVKIW
ncbi:MAG TPA: M13 family metallopeptidase [Longimicrobiales bacterium]|nr:M13 family metallopeptidase [Longimicrobiales bacterium]